MRRERRGRHWFPRRRLKFSPASRQNKSFVAVQHYPYIRASPGATAVGGPASGIQRKRTMKYKIARLDYAELDALVRRARRERDRALVELVAKGGRALARVVKGAGASIAALYEAELDRSGAQARSAMRKWAGRR
jgi:hypothetical protein